jgi:hypothetical protein
MSRTSQNYISKYAGSSIRLFPVFNHIFGISAGIMLSQLIYWENTGHRHDGYIFKTVRECQAETGLSRHQQEAAVKKLIRKGVIVTKRAGIPAKRHFYIQTGNLVEILTSWRATATEDTLKAVIQFAEKRRSTTETTAEYHHPTTFTKLLSKSSPQSNDSGVNDI